MKLRRTGEKRDVPLADVVGLLDFTGRVDFKSEAGFNAFDAIFE